MFTSILVMVSHMNSDMVVYCYTDTFNLEKFRPTGRWMIEITDLGPKLFLEHESKFLWFFTDYEWIHEDDFRFRNKDVGEVFINNCREV